MEKQTDKTADQPSTTAKIEATPSEPPKRVSVNPAVDLAGFTAAMAEACTPVGLLRSCAFVKEWIPISSRDKIKSGNLSEIFSF